MTGGQAVKALLTITDGKSDQQFPARPAAINILRTEKTHKHKLLGALQGAQRHIIIQ